MKETRSLRWFYFVELLGDLAQREGGVSFALDLW